MKHVSLESLLKKAKELEKKYEWLQAAICYKEASDSALKNKDLEKTAKLDEQMGYCYFRAALQSLEKSDFNRRIKSAIQSYDKSATLFHKPLNNQDRIKVNDSKAMISYLNSWLEVEISKKKEFLNKWWTIKTRVLEGYEQEGNQLAFAKTCNDMLERSADCRCWLGTNWQETKKMREELISLAEKAIEILSNESDSYQLARAYCWRGWYSFYILEAGAKISEYHRKRGVECAKKALLLSKKIGDDWLIGWSYSALGRGQFYLNVEKKGVHYLEQTIVHGEITKDNFLTGVGKFMFGLISLLRSRLVEDPDEDRKTKNHNVQLGQEVINHFQLINLRIWNSYYFAAISYVGVAQVEVDLERKRTLLKKAVEYGRKSVDEIHGFVNNIVPNILNGFTSALYRLSEVESNFTEKNRLLSEVIDNTKRSSKVLELYPFEYYFRCWNQTWIALANSELSEMTEDQKEKILLLEDSISSIEKGIDLIKKDMKGPFRDWKIVSFGVLFYWFGGIYHKLFLLTKEHNYLHRALEIYDESIILFNRADIKTRLAETHWQKARIQSILGIHLESAKDYEQASKEYLSAAEKIPQLKEFYRNYAFYMQAWGQIEQAKQSHSKENYNQAMKHYEEAAFLHEKSKLWNYLGSNYYAWVQLEQAEDLSRKEEPTNAIASFQLAKEYFKKSEESIEKKSKTLESAEEKNLATNLIEASGLRSRYCDSRISLEEAKILDRSGDYELSSKKYRKAAEILNNIVDELNVETERKELKYLAILCQAWEKMAYAEETASSESYLEAAALFEKAKEYCYTQKGSLWALGNSNFCKGLAAGARYQTDLELEEHNKAKGYIKNAATNYLKAGYKNASEYAKATQRLFDAYLLMNHAETEDDQEKRAKQYQMVENLLQIAAVSYTKAKQPEKTVQVEVILDNVMEEKALAVSLSQVMQAPTIASSTMSFAAPTPTKEASIGLESFEHANVQANLITQVKEVKVGESFCLSVEFVNAGREPALLMRVDDFVPQDFVVVKKPEIYRIEETSLNMKGKQLAPLKLVEVKLTLQPSKKGQYQLNPSVHYLDELGQNKTLQLKTVEINVEEVILENRITTGTEELDSLLLGGIPREYAVVLSGPPCDEREMIVNNFLNAGTENEGITFHITTETTGLEDFLDKPNFFLFSCNPRPKTSVPDLPNVYKLQSKTDITNLGITLTKAYRSIDKSIANKRVCVEILSDVLVKHGTNTTREWISSLITDLGAKGFTILAVMYPEMHQSEESKAIISLFDGEISIIQSDDPLDCKKSILIKKLRNQDYIKNPICLR